MSAPGLKTMELEPPGFLTRVLCALRHGILKISQEGTDQHWECGVESGMFDWLISIFGSDDGDASNSGDTGLPAGVWVGQGPFTAPDDAGGTGGSGGFSGPDAPYGGGPAWITKWIPGDNSGCSVGTGNDGDGGNGPVDRPDPATCYPGHWETIELDPATYDKSFLIQTLSLTQSQIDYINNHGDDAQSIAAIFDEDNNTAENTIIAEGLVEFVTNAESNTLSLTSPNLSSLKQAIKDVISQGVVSTAKATRKVYLGLSSLTVNHPSLIPHANSYVIDPIRDAVNSLAVNFDGQTMNWSDLFLVWCFELGSYPTINNNPTIGITNNANIITGNNINHPEINAFKNLTSVNALRSRISRDVKNGSIGQGGTDSEYFTYDVNAYYGSLTQQNAALIFLGSFNTAATILSVNGNSAVIQFSANNTSGWESATRFIKAADGSHIGVIDNKARGTGLNLGGNFAEAYTWTETVTW